MKKKILFSAIITAIILIAISTRFYKLGESPAGLYIDEAAQGYNAFSILKTGKDEFGKSFPFVFRSFIDFKTPVYIYLIVPLIPIFDLTSLTVRLPSFIFSILTFPILFLLLRRISPVKIAIPFSLLVIFLLSISPWHVLFSRTNFECNVALFFLLSGVYYFYKGLGKPYWFILSSILFAIAIPSYHNQRVVVPGIVLFLVIKHWKKIFGKKALAYVVTSVMFALIISLPTLSIATTPGFLARAAGLNIFSHERQLPAGFIENYDGSFGFLVNAPWFLSTWEFASLYVSYFSPRNMFLLGDSGLRDSYPELATFFVWQFPFYIYGLYLLIKRRELGELRALTLALLLIAPIPGALTRDPYASLRALNLVIPQIIIVSLGLFFLWKKFQTSFHKLAAFSTFSVIVVYSIAKLYSSGIVLNEYFRAYYWDYGWEDVAKVIQDELDPNLPIVVDNTRFEPYSQLVFFLKYPPGWYQLENYEVPPDEYYTNMNRNRDKKFANIVTRAINWDEDLTVEQYFIGDSLAVSYDQIKEHSLLLVKEIFYPNGIVAYRIVKTLGEKQ